MFRLDENVCFCFSDCVFDLCAERGDAALRCASFEAFAAACQKEGVPLEPWRQELDCGKMLSTHKSQMDMQSSAPYLSKM